MKANADDDADVRVTALAMMLIAAAALFHFFRVCVLVGSGPFDLLLYWLPQRILFGLSISAFASLLLVILAVFACGSCLIEAFVFKSRLARTCATPVLLLSILVAVYAVMSHAFILPITWRAGIPNDVETIRAAIAEHEQTHGFGEVLQAAPSYP